MKQLAQGSIGTVGSYTVSLDKGDIAIGVSVSAPQSMGALSVSASVSGKAVVDAIFAKLPQGMITAEINAAIDAVLAGT